MNGLNVPNKIFASNGELLRQMADIWGTAQKAVANGFPSKDVSKLEACRSRSLWEQANNV